MTFKRNAALNWRREAPGARWFKADLHLHTIDDHLGGKVKLPAGMNGGPGDAAVQEAYARRFLQRLVESGVHVAGLTPHSPRAGSGPESSAGWRIVDEWNEGVDDDGVPFREKVYAVFPGFEINVNDGAQGVHLLLLFDPEIGLDHYSRLFDALMDGEEPWRGGSLRMTRKSAEEVFDTLDGHNLSGSDCGDRVEFLALAPHLLTSHGLQREMGHQVREEFPLGRLAGIGLPAGKLQEDYNAARKPGRYWIPRMKAHRQAFFHGSDAYSLDQIGGRHTWLKLAGPRIEALRQAFVASDSRMRAGLRRGSDGSLVPIDDPPDASAAGRAWLRGVSVEGRASFFGVEDQGQQGATVFSFSPDLTCVIGGSMTGKSTLLDGLRVHTEAVLPQEKAVLEQVRARGEKFREGSAKVCLDCQGGNPAAQAHQRWSAQFFAQNELQRLAQESRAVEGILAKLDSDEAAGIARRQERLDVHDRTLAKLAEDLNRLDERLAAAEQAEEGARRAQKELKAFERAGVEDFHRVSRGHQNWKSAFDASKELVRQVDEVAGAVRSFVPPPLDEEVGSPVHENADTDGLNAPVLRDRWRAVGQQFDAFRSDLRLWVEDLGRFAGRIGSREASLRANVEQSMAADGYRGAELQQFQELSRQAALVSSYRRHSMELKAERDERKRRFEETGVSRETLLGEQRAALDRVLEGIAARRDSRIRGRRVPDGDPTRLGTFLKSLKQQGVTRWWNEAQESPPTPAALLEHLHGETLGSLGMSPAVQKTFRETVTSARRRQLAALRCRDLYVLELEVAEGTFKLLSDLSGGQRVSVLLTLLLETDDERPLVIDQPEDELDNRFLFETVLPALKKLKGRRQVIVATHNANIVVNGDADMVIQLDASADKGRVACAGAIDDPAVRDAIVQTVDGGRDAFRLRRRKYGF